MSGSRHPHSPPPPMRTASSEGSVLLAHPTPDLQSLQGAYVQNVERLEERAERMSIGSDIGEEIRKLQQEQKLSDSRKSSLLSSAVDEPPPRSRTLSTSSYANSIVEVNSAARYGGYSPAGFIGSPIGSLRSGSWSQVSYTASARSMTKGPRLGMVSSHEFGDELVHSPIDDSTITSAPNSQAPTTLSHSSLSEFDDTTLSAASSKRASRLPSDGSFTDLYKQMTESNGLAAHLAAVRIPSDTSFTDIYDQIAGEIRDHLDTPANDGNGQMARSVPAQQSPVDKLSRQADVTSIPDEEENTAMDDPTVRNPNASRMAENGPIDQSQERPENIHPQSGNTSQRTSYNENRASKDPYDRPATAASTNTYQQAQTLFRDFDGAHYAPSIRESIMEDVGELNDIDEEMRRSSILRMLPQPESRLPPPGDGMVYYPAPVPRMLNLPQRLSQAPSAAIQAKRRTQLLDSLPSDMRKSAPWLDRERRGSGSGMSDVGDPRASKMNLASLPPQLRASMFFEHAPKRQQVEVQGSAMATFEDLLDASAKAPVSAFTDHPIVGHLGAGVYKKEAATRSSVSLTQLQKEKDKKDKEKPRGSFLGLRRSSISSSGALEGDGAKTTNKIQRRNSHGTSMMFDDATLNRGPDGEIIGTGSGRTTPLRQSRLLDENGEPIDGELLDDDEEFYEDANEIEKDEEEEVEWVGPPTTLLAELQMRKAEQKNRNRNAFTSFPNGMHSTLLEMDAVAQLEKQKRKKTRVALAWEDPSLRAAEDAAGHDDDVPLGMLFANNTSVKHQLREQGLADWDRPLGLLEKRQMEDNEPLSKRRNRLLGIPNAPKNAPSVHITVSGEAEGGAESESEHEGETLKERLQRLKDKKALDETIDTGNRPISTAFTTEMMGELGLDDPDRKKSPLLEGKKSPLSQQQSREGSPGPDRSQGASPAEETLGQRRARLKREASAQMPRQNSMAFGSDGIGLNRRQSQMSLGPDATMNSSFRRQSQMTLNPDPIRASIYMPTDGNMQAERPFIQKRASLADLLASNPVGKNDARKVSNELLVASLPQGSLLAQHEERSQGRKAQLQESNRRSSGLLIGGNNKPFIDLPEQRPSAQRQMSAGFRGGIYNTGGGVISAAQEMPPQQQQFGMANPYQTQMPMYQMGMPMGNNYATSSPNLLGMQSFPQMPTYPQMSTYPQMQAYSQMPTYHQMGVQGVGGFGAMSNPNLLAGMQGFGGMSNPNLMNDMGYGMAAPQYPAQTNPFSGMGLPHLAGQTRSMMAAAEPPIDPKTRDRVDAWRQSVMP